MQIAKLFWHIYMQSHILFIISLIFFPIAEQRAQRIRFRLCSSVAVPNANIRYRHNYKIMRIICAPGFTLQGSQMVACEKGKWNEAIPVCTKEGCLKPDDPPNGLVLSSRLTASLYCEEKYKIAGARVTYCNGTHWDRPLGQCRETNDTIQLSCDFETDDLCGWSHDETSHFLWKRIMAANTFLHLRTGPQHDHTTLTANSGHFMLMESFDQHSQSVARLISPIYSKSLVQNSGCFKFFYYMYGATVGDLNVYVKPVSVDIDTMLQDSVYQHFTLSGNQANLWKEGVFNIKEMTEDFQIVIEGTTGTNHLSDIAIDDVKLMTYSECNGDSTTIMTEEPDFTENAIYDIQSCEGRCSETNSTFYGIKNIDGKIIKMCDCHSDCENLQTCCPNYRLACEFGNWDSTFSDMTTNMHTIENSTPSTTTSLLTTPSTTPSTKSVTTPTQKTSYSTSASTTRATTTSTSTSTTTTTPSTTTSTTTTTTTTKKPTTIKTTTTTKLTTSTATAATRTPLPKTTVHAFSSTNSEKKNTTEFTPTQHTILEQISTSQRAPPKKREKTITWEVDRSLRKQNEHSAWLILIITVTILIAVVLILLFLRHHGKIGRSRLHHDTTTLIYNQGNDIILQN